MHIVHFASECTPIAKAGGLADVVQGLTNQQKQNHTITIVLPFYELSSTSVDIAWEKQNFTLPSKKTLSFLFKKHLKSGCTYFYIKAQEPTLFPNNAVYLGKEDRKRFLFFSFACFSLLQQTLQKVDLVHLHDWHTSFCAYLIKKHKLPYKTVLSLHNLAYQGGGCSSFFDQELQAICHPMQKTEPINILAQGIQAVDRMIVVSPTYAKEILTKEKSENLLSLLEKNKHKISGIINGLDIDYWDPSKDPHIPYHFHQKMPIKEIFSQKEKNKHALQKKLSLAQSKEPLIIVVTRMVHQKGPELIEDLLHWAKNRKVSVIILASIAKDSIGKHWLELQKHPLSDTQKILLYFDEALSHLLYASADFLFMPSRFEPCGLSQLISMRYGCLPIVRATGGLIDTVKNGVNGWSFSSYEKHACRQSLEDALSCMKTPKHVSLVQTAINGDFSWDCSAKEYEKVYEELLEKTPLSFES